MEHGPREFKARAAPAPPDPWEWTRLLLKHSSSERLQMCLREPVLLALRSLKCRVVRDTGRDVPNQLASLSLLCPTGCWDKHEIGRGEDMS